VTSFGQGGVETDKGSRVRMGVGSVLVSGRGNLREKETKKRGSLYSIILLVKRGRRPN